jgi:hypothetical protein
MFCVRVHAYVYVNLGLLIRVLSLSTRSKRGSSMLKYSQNSAGGSLNCGELERAYLLARENRVQSHVIGPHFTLWKDQILS